MQGQRIVTCILTRSNLRELLVEQAHLRTEFTVEEKRQKIITSGYFCSRFRCKEVVSAPVWLQLAVVVATLKMASNNVAEATARVL